MSKLTLAAAAVACILLSNDAFAHAALKHTQPAAGSTISTSPSSVTLDFSEGVVAKLSGITIRDAGGKPVRSGKPTKGAGTAALSASIDQPLSPGTYTVSWRAVSVDTHRSQGSFSFTVSR